MSFGYVFEFSIAPHEDLIFSRMGLFEGDIELSYTGFSFIVVHIKVSIRALSEFGGFQLHCRNFCRSHSGSFHEKPIHVVFENESIDDFYLEFQDQHLSSLKK